LNLLSGTVIYLLICLSAATGKVYIDDNNATIVDGKPFFPLGLYAGQGPASDEAISELDEIADSPFNVIMNYGINSGSIKQIRSYLDAVNERGLKIIYSIKDFYRGTKYYPREVGPYRGEEEMTRGVIREFRNHPAILAWYLNDELPRSYIPRLTQRYRLVKQLDPNHPTWTVLYQVDELRFYLNTADVIGTDPYPIPQKAVSLASEWTQKTRKAAGPRRAVWMVPQAHNLGIYHDNSVEYTSPTFEEMRCMAYQCLVNGANGLIFYSFFDLKRDPLGFDKRWAEVKKLGAEIKSLMPVLLSTEELPRVQLAKGSRYIHFSTKRHDGKLYILAVNISREEQDAEFAISAEVEEAKALFEERSVPVEKYRLLDKLQPIAAHVYEIQMKEE
jgi:hypothetical protein